MEENIINAKPFLKWAGGKKQLLMEFDERLPSHLKDNGTINRYVEPFVGGGAMFFFLKQHYNIIESILFDINRELVMAYQVIKNDHESLIKILKDIGEDHLKYNEEGRKKNYYRIRDIYNSDIQSFDYQNYNKQWIERTAYFIFMNKTCFNGLFRQNKNGEFNVPFGLYKNPKICDETNIKFVNRALEDTDIYCSNFTNSEKYIDKGVFVYLDPPYRPLNKTSNFTAYSKEGFNDFDQVKLASFFKEMDRRGAYLMLSNSDPKNENTMDEFFDELYTDYRIDRVPAKRNINSNAMGRGIINELIVRNY
jgi:DNA adenine methylase